MTNGSDAAKAALSLLTLIAVLALGVSACSASDAPSTSAAPSVSTPSTVVDSGFQATTMVTGLRIPWEIRILPDGRLLVTEREGRIVIADAANGTVTEVGKIEVQARGEAGLMGLALDPDFSQTRLIYVAYTYSEGGDDGNRISRFALERTDTDSPSLGEETVLVDGIPAGSIHDGCRLAFGPDGHLWATTGDSGDGELAQRMDSLAGKVLRLTRDGEPPSDNPFLDRPYPFSLIYTLGHRNPQGLAFHPDTGVAYVTEHGPSDNDEVNLLEAGANYGWPDLRGIEGRSGFADALSAWTPTIAPAGALFYTGGVSAYLSEFEGSLAFVTLKESDIRILVPTDRADFRSVAREEILFDGQFGRLRSIAQGLDGALFVGTSNHDGRGDPREGDDRIIRIERQ